MPKHLNDQLGLEVLLADLRFARKNEELGRLALLAYCEVKTWARRAGESEVAEMALRMFSENPHLRREDFLQGIDSLIAKLELQESNYVQSAAQFEMKKPPLGGCDHVTP